MKRDRFNAYRIMWLIVFFDLPTQKKTERKAYTKFRKDLMKDGFTMLQYSVYIRHCASRENTEVHLKRVKNSIPEKGHISVMTITDKQYGDIINFWGRKDSPLKRAGSQLELF
ncbi:CRISPR-associated endonuclease Cas2 [bacterium]|nr:CRISPR-associated endonuclease Cas2 [bacterium]